MIVPARWLFAFVFVVVGEPASAHSVFGITGFSGGLLHPLLVPAHLTAIVALALLIGRQGLAYGVPIVFAVAIWAGLGTIALGTVPALAEETVLAAAGAMGLLVALGWPVLWVVEAGLAAVAGYALGLDSPPEAISLREANLTLLGTALSAILLLVLLAYLASKLRRDWQRIGARILCSWIAASAILVLALRLFR
jgi:urease accessory protein